MAWCLTQVVSGQKTVVDNSMWAYSRSGLGSFALPTFRKWEKGSSLRWFSDAGQEHNEAENVP